MSKAPQDCGEEGGDAFSEVDAVSGCLALDAWALGSERLPPIPPRPRVLQRAHEGGSEELEAGKHVS